MRWLRLFARVLAGAVVLLALALAILLGPLRERLVGALRPYLEQTLSAVLETPVSIGAVRLTWMPLQVELEAVRVGPDGRLASAPGLTAQVRVRTSLRQLRPVADVWLPSAAVDLPGWIELAERLAAGPSSPSQIPPFRIRARFGPVSLRITGEPEPLDLAVAGGEGELNSALGRLGFSADTREVTMGRAGRTLQLSQAAASGGEALTGGWYLSRIDAVGDGVELHGRAKLGNRLPIQGHVALARLAVFSQALERLSGDAAIDAALVGGLEEFAGEATVRVTDLAADGERAGDLDVSGAWTLEEIRISSAHLASEGGTADVEGGLTLVAPYAYSARLRWSGLDPHRLPGVDAAALKPVSAAGQMDLTGMLEPLAIVGEGGGTMAAATGTPLEWRGRATYRAATGGGELEATQGSANRVRGQIAIGAGRTLSGGLEIAVADPTALGAFLPIESLPALQGSLTASAQLAGTVDDPQISGRVAGRNVVLLGVSIDTLDGTVAADRSRLQIDQLRADLGQGTLHAAGTVALADGVANDWWVDATDLSGDVVVGVTYALTGTVPPIGRGLLDVQLSGRGPWAHPELSGRAVMRDFWLTREWITQATVAGSASGPGWQLTAELRNRADQTLGLQATGTRDTDVSLTVHSGGWDLTTLQRGEFAESGGRVAVDASFRGPLRGLTGSGTVQTEALVLSGRALGAITVEIDATRGRWQFSTALLEGALRLRGGLTPDPGWPFTLDGEWSEARFGRLLVPTSDIWIVSTGTLHAAGRLTALGELDAAVRIAALRIVNGPYELTAAAPAELRCRRGACALEQLNLRGTDTDLRARGTVSTTGAVQMSLQGQGDLRLFELIGPPVESARGRFGIDLEIVHGGGRWDVSGTATLDEVALDVGAPVALTRTSGRLVLSGSVVRVEQLGGRIGTGRFAIGGIVDLTRGPDLTWTLTDVGANPAPSLEVELSGAGTVTGTWERMLVAGRIDVDRMLYDRDIELLDLLPQLNQALAEAPRPPSAQRVALDLHIVAPGELFVENNIARLEARADLRLTGTASAPVLDGRVEVLDGTVTFRDRVFEIFGATADFRPDLGLAAALNVSAESTIDTPDATYIVDVYVTGTTREPRVTLSSDDPTLTQTDLGTLIALGKTSAQLREGGGGSFSFGTTQSTKQLLPIDRISFESTYSRISGTFEPQLKLGKDLTDSLSVAVGQTFGVSSRTLAEADYRLTPRVFLTGNWQSQTSTQEGAFGAGVKVRYEFWRVTAFTLLGGALR